MKKILLTLIFCGLFFAHAVMAAESGTFLLAKSFFTRKDYASADMYFVKAVTEYPNNATYRYYYAQNLTYLKRYEQARKEYGYVMQLAPNTQLANYSKQSIAYLDGLTNKSSNSTSAKTNTSSSSSSGNYIKRALNTEGNLVTWDMDKMPLKIYIDNSKHVSTAFVNEAKAAAETWKTASGNKLQFIYVDNPSFADITIKFLGMATKTDNQALGLTNHSVLNGYMHKATINLYTLGPGYKPLKASDVYNVALHEFGHAIGISGHSDGRDDIMYATYDPINTKGKVSLSASDINTAKALYEIDKNPYSTASNSINKVLGSQETRLNDKLEQSLAYIKSVPGAPSGYVNAANVYMKLGKEVEAIEYYKKALSIAPSDHGANLNLAELYKKRNDIKNAEIYYKNLIKYEPKFIAAYTDLAELYLKNNKKQNARTILSALTYRNSQAKNNPQVQKLINETK